MLRDDKGWQDLCSRERKEQALGKAFRYLRLASYRFFDGGEKAGRF
jgi:hypothetical protein